MHVATSFIVIFIIYFWGDWRNWKQYHSTMLYIALCNLLYNFLTANHFLWRLNADFISNHTLTEMLYTFIVFPGTIILFLGNYPKGLKWQIVHHVKWIVIYITWEGFFLFTNRIEYQYGWSIWWSLTILCFMFPAIRLHERKPLLTYILSAIATVVFIWLFDVPVNVPVEDR